MSDEEEDAPEANSRVCTSFVKLGGETLRRLRLMAEADYTIMRMWVSRAINVEWKKRDAKTGHRLDQYDPSIKLEEQIAVLRDRIEVMEKAMLAIRRHHLAQIGQ